MKSQVTTLFFSLTLALAIPLSASGQEEDIPLLTPEEEAAVQSQTTEIFKLLSPIGHETAASVVSISAASPRQSCYGAVIGDGKHVLTKWSEVVDRRRALRVIDSTGNSRPAAIEGVYEDEDLAVLSIEGTPLPVVKWSTQPQPALGHFLVAVKPDGKAAGFGVVSVMERSLRDSNQAYLGLMGDINYTGIGAKIINIEPNTGAAAAGLMIGDVILKVGDRQISGLRELRNSLNDKKPSDRVAVLYSRDGVESTIEILLGGRPHLAQPYNQRLKQMEQMGGEVSRVRDGFSRVIQTDMQIKPEQCGGPILDLKGNIIGLSVARSDRTRSFIISAAEISELLKRPATDPMLAKVATTQDEQMAEMDQRQQSVPPAMPPLDERGVQRMRRHMRDMQRLMEHMQQEMEGMEGQEEP
jgi:serine protease Do